MENKYLPHRPPSHSEMADSAKLSEAINKAKTAGYVHTFTPRPLAWFANGHHHFDVKVCDSYSWYNSTGKEVVVFLLAGFNIKGFSVSEFEPEPPP